MEMREERMTFDSRRQGKITSLEKADFKLEAVIIQGLRTGKGD